MECPRNSQLGQGGELWFSHGFEDPVKIRSGLWLGAREGLEGML